MFLSPVEDNEMPTAQFPYTFAARKADFQRSLPPFHDKLTENRCDIAFEVEWTALSPVAANPCSDSGPSSAPENNSEPYAGYDKRWLTVGGKLALSPFTVKSAIANGFANLLGGCYRINSEVVGHTLVEPGQYPYTGKYKRYRVGMDGQSKPGIVTDIKKIAGKGYEVTIQCAKEFYLDTPLPAGINPGDRVFVTKTDRRHRPAILSNPTLTTTGINGEIAVYYLEPFQYGMNLGKSHRLHSHRFIQLQEGTVSGIIPFLNFKNLSIQKKVVYMGQFKNDPSVQWHETLSKLHPGSWVYYEEFNGQVTHIGQNFLFKALFCHSDTIPPGQETCNVRDNLCPRCQMYGITTESENREVDAGGYRGRFKASTLVSADILEPEEKLPNQRIPHEDSSNDFTNVSLLQWKSGGKTVARQFLMPIAGPPKPNKRDVNGYFNQKTGFLKGPKKYRHGSFDVANLQEWGQQVATLNQKTDRNSETRNFNYSHKLRNYAMVCEGGTSFKGTVGAENCSPDEAAALLMLLETRIAGHGFKIGLGKSWGLGSITSVIKRIWIRTPESDRWDSISCNENPVHLNMPELEKRLKGIEKALQLLKKVQDINIKINTVEGHGNRKLEFPEDLSKYWTKALKTGLNG
jgi:hypothetical protein